MLTQQKKEMTLAVTSFILACIALGGILAFEFSFMTVVLAVNWLVITFIAFRKIREIKKSQTVNKLSASS